MTYHPKHSDHERDSSVKKLGTLAAALYLFTIVAANWAVSTWGIVDVGFGQKAPAAVFFVALALLLRDYVQYTLGRVLMLLALVAGIGVSALVAPKFAFASAVAFAFSELLDFVLFTWVAPRWARAVLAGGIAGAVVDSWLFLHYAFHSEEFFTGQLLGKAYGVVAASVLIALWRSRLVAQPDPA